MPPAQARPHQGCALRCAGACGRQAVAQRPPRAIRMVGVLAGPLVVAGQAAGAAPGSYGTRGMWCACTQGRREGRRAAGRAGEGWPGWLGAGAWASVAGEGAWAGRGRGPRGAGAG